MIKYILVAVLMVLILIGVSGGVDASEHKKLQTTDVICATLAFNAGYDAKGEWYFRNRIEEHFEANKERIRQIVDYTHTVVGDMAEENDAHPVQVYRDVFNDKCMAPFA